MSLIRQLPHPRDWALFFNMHASLVILKYAFWLRVGSLLNGQKMSLPINYHIVSQHVFMLTFWQCINLTNSQGLIVREISSLKNRGVRFDNKNLHELGTFSEHIWYHFSLLQINILLKLCLYYKIYLWYALGKPYI